MSTGEETSIMKSLEDMTECCICRETYNDPRVLPCMHTFCQRCLQRTGLQMKKKPGHLMPCPLCKEDFEIPQKGWDHVKKNFFMTKLIEMTTAVKPPEQRTLCNDCETGNQTEAEMRCSQCCKNLCPKCCEDHRKWNPSHQLSVKCAESKNDTAKLSAGTFCKLHPKKPIHLYCADCSECICTGCLVASHKEHKFLQIDSASVEFRKDIGINIERVSDCMLKCKAKRDELEQEKVQFLEEMKAIEKEVNKTGQQLKALVQKHSDSLLEELSSITKKRLKRLDTEKEEVERQLVFSESFRQYCTDVSTKGSPGHICQSMKNLQTMSNEMQALLESCVQRKLSADQIFLTKTNWNPSTDNTQKWNAIGEIKVMSRASVELKRRLDVAAKGIHGVAKLSGSIYVLCRAPNSVFVYSDQSPFDFKEEIITESIRQPKDMAACHQSNCLYVTDGYVTFTKSGNKCVWKITDETSVTSWLSNVGSPWTISVCKDGRVAMLRDGGHRAQLEVYQPDSRLSQSLLLPADLQEPLHATQTSNGNFMISCRYAGSWALCEVAIDGHLVAKFRPENDPERLDFPCHLSKYFDDRILVADRNNHRVVLITLEPKCSQVVLTRSEDAIKRPRQVLYDPSIKQLIVVHGVFRGRKMLDICSLG